MKYAASVGAARYIRSLSSNIAIMTAYWRQAGMSYLKYVNLCSDLVRNGIKVCLGKHE